MKKLLTNLTLWLISIILWSCSPEEQLAYTSPESLREAKIGVAMGSVHDTFVSENYPDASIQRTESMVELPLLLNDGRVDFILLDENVAKSMLLQYPTLEVVDEQIFVSDIVAGFSYNNPTMCQEFNDFMSEFSKGEIYADIVKRWHQDGDGGQIPEIEQIADGKRVRVGLSSLIPPFCMVKDNQLQGSSVEIAKHFALKYGYTLEFNDMNITGLLSSIQTNKVDLLIPGLIYTEERGQSILCSETYIKSGSRVIARKSERESQEFVYSPQMLENSRIAVLTGAVSDIYASENYPGATVIRIDNMSEFYPILKRNAADFLFVDLPQLVEIQSIYADFVIADPNIFELDCAAILPKGSESLRDEINEFLREFKQTEEFAELFDRWINRGDITNIPKVEAVKSSRKITIATDSNNFPYNTIVDGEITGYEIEIFKHFALKNNLEVEFLNMNFNALINAVASNKVDLAACSVCITQEREQNFLFTDVTSSISTGVGYIQKESAPAEQYQRFVHPQVTSLNQGAVPNADDTIRCYTQDKIVAVVEGSTHEQYISALLPASQVSIAKDYSDAFLSVTSGKADCLLSNIGVAKGFKKQSDAVEIVLQDIMAYDTRFGLDKKSTQLKNQINQFLATLRSDGTLDRLSEKWLTYIDEATFDEPHYDENAPVLRVGSSCTAVPYTFISDGRVVGLDIEVISLFCQAAGYRLEVVQMPFGALISAISTGKVDVIANNISATPERLEKIDFTDPFGSSCVALLHALEPTENLGSSTATKQNFFETIKVAFTRNILTEKRYEMILQGVWVTTIISFLSIIFGTLIGAGVCFMSMSKSRLLRSLGRLYVTILRGTPVLVILMINFYVIFAQTPLSPVWVATISFAMNFGAYVSEMFRSSILSIDKGQREAGLAIGLSNVKTFVLIIAPQAINRVMPVFKGEAISLVKMTSVVGYIAVQDITKVGDIIRSRTFDAFFPLLVSALLYFLIAYLFSLALDLITSKLIRKKL